MISPPNGSTLPASNVTFQWSAGGWSLSILALCQQRDAGGAGNLQRQPGNQHIQDVYQLAHGRRHNLRPPLVGNRGRVAISGLQLPKRDGSYPDRAPYHPPSLASYVAAATVL